MTCSSEVRRATCAAWHRANAGSVRSRRVKRGCRKVARRSRAHRVTSAHLSPSIGDDSAHWTRLRLMFSRRSSRLQRQRLQRQVQDVVDIAVCARHLKRVSRRALVRQDRVGTRRPAPTFARCRPLLSCSTLQDLIAGRLLARGHVAEYVLRRCPRGSRTRPSVCAKKS